jgi:hypothetical protein
MHRKGGKRENNPPVSDGDIADGLHIGAAHHRLLDEHLCLRRMPLRNSQFVALQIVVRAAYT